MNFKFNLILENRKTSNKIKDESNHDLGDFSPTQVIHFNHQYLNHVLLIDLYK